MRARPSAHAEYDGSSIITNIQDLVYTVAATSSADTAPTTTLT